MTNKIFLILIAISIIFYSLLYSHPGRLDSSGGHRDSRTGTYHYHRASSSSYKETLLFIFQVKGEYNSDKDNIIIEIVNEEKSFWKEKKRKNKFQLGYDFKYGFNTDKEYKIKSLKRQNKKYEDVNIIFLDRDNFTIELEKDNIYKFTKIKAEDKK